MAIFVLGIIPNRRYGVALGAFAGLGYSVVAIIYLATVQQHVADPLWYLMHPIWHIIFGAFLGIAVFALVAEASAGRRFVNAMFGLPLLFFLIFIVMELVFEGIGTLTSSGPYWGIKFLILPLYVFILRDFLGDTSIFKTSLNQCQKLLPQSLKSLPRHLPSQPLPLFPSSSLTISKSVEN
ncbi:MAG: hypothetical protein QXG27_02875 [Candidatus Bathyarchaeia archaeon]